MHTIHQQSTHDGKTNESFALCLWRAGFVILTFLSSARALRETTCCVALVSRLGHARDSGHVSDSLGPAGALHPRCFASGLLRVDVGAPR